MVGVLLHCRSEHRRIERLLIVNAPAINAQEQPEFDDIVTMKRQSVTREGLSHSVIGATGHRHGRTQIERFPERFDQQISVKICRWPVSLPREMLERGS